MNEVSQISYSFPVAIPTQIEQLEDISPLNNSSIPAEMIFVLGGPGSGKGTQCSILVQKYNFIHISTGDLLREEVKRGSPLGKQIHQIIKDGNLVSSDLMVRLIREQIKRNNYTGRYLLDGFPRNSENMEVWKKVMEDSIQIRSVLYFDCQKPQLKRRLINRGKTSGRSDDCEEAIKRRLDIFQGLAQPVLAYYQKINKLIHVNGNRSIEEVTHQIQEHFKDIGVLQNSA